MAAPIKPGQVSDRKLSLMPDAVIEVFNDLIARNFRGGQSRVVQKDVVAALVAKGLKKEDIFANNWLDIEGLYARQGWSVQYDYPGWDESYDPFFVFKQKSH